MEKQLLYKDLSKYYDLIYSQKDYKQEAEKIKRLISKYKKSEGNDLLEVASGTGKHLPYLKKDFKILATDISPEMLKIARKNIKGIQFKQADMLDLDLGKKFDVVLCLFSSIGYVKTYSNLKKVINNFSRHLKKGGVVIVDPWFTKAVFRIGSPHMETYADDGIKIVRQSVSKARGNVSVVDMHYLVAERGKDVRHFVDRHELGMFEIKEVIGLMEKAGLRALFLKDGLMKEKGIYIGIKR